MDALRREQAQLADSVPPMSFLGQLIDALVEVLSRLTVKLNSKELDEAFSVAMQISAEPGVYSHITLHDSCHYWFVRLFTAAGESSLYSWLPDLMRYPFPDERKRSRNPRPWRDPISAFPMDRIRPDILLSNERTKEIREATKWLLDRARSDSEEGWRTAARRLITVSFAELMTDGEETEMAHLIWRDTAEDGFPNLPGVFRYVYGHLPIPPSIEVKEKVRSYLLDGKPLRSVSVQDSGRTTVSHTLFDSFILEMAYASKPIVHIPYEPKGFVDWSRDETKMLWSRVIEWWHNERRALETHSPFGYDNIIATVQHAGTFLRQAVLPNMKTASDDDWKEVLTFLEETRKHDVYLTAAWPYVLIHRPDDGGRVERMIIDDLSSDIKDSVEAGASALRHWIHLARAGRVEGLSAEVFDALLHRVVYRRPAGVALCLQQIARLLCEHQDCFEHCHVDVMISSLSPWVEAVGLSTRGDGDSGFREQERPELRALLGNLASALSAWLRRKAPDHPEPDAISRLRSRYESDPLPEVRRSFCVWRPIRASRGT